MAAGRAAAGGLRLRLSSRLALVTGGGSGIGRAVCQRFADEGATVAVVDIDEGSANETLKSLPCDRQQHSVFRTDVTSPQSVHSLVSSVQEKFSRPPCITVNCAGITMDDLLLKMEAEAFDRVLKVNLMVGNLGQANYTASKAGVMALTKTSAKELARFGIRCNAILPGFIDTPMAAKVPPKILEKVLQLVPMGRLGDPSEVASACAFLASDDSSYITGANLEVTGGLFM
ncbi:estradiol 17-beta-dehydrogenase 8 isoform X2 [Pristis pectinata]|uniref:estradiol 17-beta-dehydrogenase 8 isoform X2 n=1 Tax=Pristis pectinata TaxID=685728 RepID=UPI00223CC031|nr:estradiol 17-beta-dehydrogenase 8 isoform X2 [Pristis pectinata]